MNNILSSSFRLSLMGGAGYLCGKCLGTNPKLSALVWVVSQAFFEIMLNKTVVEAIVNMSVRAGTNLAFPLGLISYLVAAVAMRELKVTTNLAQTVIATLALIYSSKNLFKIFC